MWRAWFCALNLLFFLEVSGQSFNEGDERGLVFY